MNKCPVCYGSILDKKCQECGTSLTKKEIQELKADTYDSIINHLFESMEDPRKREQVRCKIALRNIKKWAKDNKMIIDAVEKTYGDV